MVLQVFYLENQCGVFVYEELLGLNNGLLNAVKLIQTSLVPKKVNWQDALHFQ